MAKERVPSLRIRFFGAFEVQRADGPVPRSAWRTEVNRALVKVLAAERGRFFPRDALIERLWPEPDPSRAAASLRRRVAEVRRILEPDLASGRNSRFILTRREGYTFDPEAPVWIDLEAFARRLTRGRALEEEGAFDKAARALESAIALCPEGFLPEDPYIQWVVEARRNWRERYLEGLARLAACHARLGRYQRAIACCHRLLEVAPHREAVYRQLMTYCHLAGLVGEAQHAYRRCELALREIQAAPSEATRTLRDQIRHGHVPGVDFDAPRRNPVPAFEARYALSPSTVPFVGREEALARLVHHHNHATEGEPGLVLIQGEAGMGKTRLLQEFLRGLSEQKAAALLGGGQEGMSLAYQAWSEVLREAVFDLDHDALASIPTAWLRELLPLVPDLQGRLPELKPNAALPAQAMQMRLFESVVQFLQRYRQARGAVPLVLCFDDLMWLDSSSLALLNYLLARAGEGRLCVVATSRIEETPGDTPLASVVKTWRRRGVLHTLTLDRWSKEDVRDLLESLPFAKPIPKGFPDWFYGETEGHPLFAVSALQHFFERGLLKAGAREWRGVDTLFRDRERIGLPRTIQDLIEHRLSQLPPAAQQLLALASVLGERADFALLEQAWSGEGDPLALLERLVEDRFLRETEAGYRFVHAKVRQFVYERLSRARRRQLHLRVLRALETRPIPHAADLSFHAHAAGAWAQAARHALRAAREASAAHRLPEGLASVERGLSALTSWRAQAGNAKAVDEVEFELVKQRLELLDQQGDREAQTEALAHLEQRAVASDAQGKLALVRYQRGRLLYRQGDLEGSEALAKEALARAQAPEDRPLAFSAQQLLGLALLKGGRAGEALRASRAAFALAETLDNPRLKGMALNNLGITYKDLGRNREALRCYEDALAVFERVGDRYGEAIFHDNISIEHRLLGDYGSALSHSQAALWRFRRIGNRQGEGVCLNNRGRLYLHLGGYEDALRLLHRALEVNRRVQDALADGFVFHNLGKCHRLLGDSERADESLSKALQVRKDANSLQGQALTLTELGELRRSQSRPETALDLLHRSESIFEELGPSPDRLTLWNGLARTLLDLDRPDEALASSERALAGLKAGLLCDDVQAIHYDHARILQRLGRETEAREHLQRARAEVRGRAESIPDERLRERFLEHVPLNREIMENSSLSS